MASAEQAISWTQESLRRFGWLPAVADSPVARRLVRDGHEAVVNADACWLCARIPVDWEHGLEVDRTALQLSDLWYLVKFGRDAGGALALQLELPLAILDRRFCRLAAEALAIFHARAISPPTMAQPIPPTRTPPGRETPNEDDVISQATIVQLGHGVGQDNWSLKARLGPNRYKFYWRGVNLTYAAYLSLNKVWACLQLPAPPAVAAGQQAHPALGNYLLRLNDQLHWARYGLDPLGQVVLSLELPVDAVNPSSFSWALRTLGRYAAEHMTEAQLMSRLGEERRLAQLLAGVV